MRILQKISRLVATAVVVVGAVMMMAPAQNVSAADASYDVTGKTASQINTDLATLFGSATSGDTITVTGSDTVVQILDLTVPAGVTVLWQAAVDFNYPSSSMNDMAVVLRGAGLFDVTSGGAITGTGGMYNMTGIYNMGATNIIVSGGTIDVNSPNRYATGIYSYTGSSGNIKVTGGMVKATGNLAFSADTYAIAISTAASSVYVAYLSGTLTGDILFNGHNAFELDTLTIPLARDNTTTGITMLPSSADYANRANYVWDTVRSVPYVINAVAGVDVFQWGQLEAEPTFCELNPTSPECNGSGTTDPNGGGGTNGQGAKLISPNAGVAAVSGTNSWSVVALAIVAVLVAGASSVFAIKKFTEKI